MGERLAKPREIVLGAGNEYRFELDPGTSLGIKVSLFLSIFMLAHSRGSWFEGKRRFLVLSSLTARRICSTRNARQLFSHGKVASWR